jgi:hypothetical protein
VTSEDRCPPTGCVDDVCHGTSECIATGYPLAEACSGCGVPVFAELGEECDCPPYDDHHEEDDDHDCSCPYCPCMNNAYGGGVCNDCLAGAHQG